MLDLVANDHRENVHDDLSNDEKCCSKKNITQRPSVIQSIDNQDDLKDDIDDESNAVDDEIKDPQNSWIAVTKRSILVECSNGDSTNDEEDNEGTDTNGLEVK